MFQMSNELFTFQRRAAEAALLVRKAVAEDGRELRMMPMSLLVCEVYNKVQDLLNNEFYSEIRHAKEISMYVIDHLEMDGFVPSGMSAEAYYYCGTTLEWELEGFDD